MSNENYDTYGQNIDTLFLDIMLPLRPSKIINRDAFDKLYSILDNLKEFTSKQTDIPIKLVGSLFLLYTCIISESYHAKYPEPILMEAARFETYLDEIFRCGSTF